MEGFFMPTCLRVSSALSIYLVGFVRRIPPPGVRRRIDAYLTDSTLLLHNEERNTSVLKPGDNHTTAPDTQQGEDYEHEDVTSQFIETRSS